MTLQRTTNNDCGRDSGNDDIIKEIKKLNDNDMMMVTRTSMIIQILPLIIQYEAQMAYNVEAEENRAERYHAPLKCIKQATR